MPDFSFTTVMLAIFALFTTALVFYLNRTRLRFALEIWRRVRFVIVAQVLLMILLTFAGALILFRAHPFFEWGWLNFFTPESGNVFIQPVATVAHAVQKESLVQVLFGKAVALAFYVMVLLALPFITFAEEVIFRRGHISHKEIAFYSVSFGLIHLTVGIPVAASVMLVGVGYCYGYLYRRAYHRFLQTMGTREALFAATLHTATYHTIYNSFLILSLIVLEFV